MIRLLPARLANARTVLFIVAVTLTACDSERKGLQLGEEKIDSREAQHTAAMIETIKQTSLKAASDGQVDGMIKRFNQGKTLGCFDATFTVAQDLPAELQQGIFANGQVYPAQLRFANATRDDDRDKDFRGVSLKLKGVMGKTLWGKDGEQDFLFNSYPALFAANPEDFLAFIEASSEGKLWQYFIHPGNLYSLAIVLKGREKITDPLAIQYWSTTPYRFGEDKTRAVKYSLKPCEGSATNTKVASHNDFLTDAMLAHLEDAPACFDFMVQLQNDPVAMPIENASVIWDEEKSPFIKLASILIADGGTADATRENCESMTFNPWQSLEAHRPLGGINRARLAIYSEIGQFRVNENIRRGFQ